MTPRDVLIVSFIGAFFGAVIALVLALAAWGLYGALDRLHEAIEQRRVRHPEPAAEKCCERWWTSFGTDHDPTCPNQKRSRTT